MLWPIDSSDSSRLNLTLRELHIALQQNLSYIVMPLNLIVLNTGNFWHSIICGINIFFYATNKDMSRD